jgi:hypothetical protein
MTVTRLTDAIIPEVFFNYMLKETKQKSAFYSAGVMGDAPEMAEKLSGGGRTFNVPFWKDLDDTESDTASDDPASDAVPGGLTSGKDIARRQVRTRGWSTANLVRELAGDDPMQRIASRVGEYWARQFDDVAIATARGLFADNTANNAGDMVNALGTDNVAAITAAELFSADAVLDTAQTMGDAKNDLSLLAMHSVVHNRLAKQNLITYRLDAEGKVWWPHYLDYRVHVSDKCPAIVGTNRTTYHTYLMGAGALGWAESPVAKPVSTDSDESAADGMGIEELWTRRQFACHPYGIKFTDVSVAGEFPTNAELMTATNWTRVYAERKQIPMALLTTNG